MGSEGKVGRMPPFPITRVCSAVSGEAHPMGQDGLSFITASEEEWRKRSLSLVFVSFGEGGVALVNFPLAK